MRYNEFNKSYNNKKDNCSEGYEVMRKSGVDKHSQESTEPMKTSSSFP